MGRHRLMCHYSFQTVPFSRNVIVLQKSHSSGQMVSEVSLFPELTSRSQEVHILLFLFGFHNTRVGFHHCEPKVGNTI